MNKVKILIVEDDPIVRRFTERHAEHCGHEVVGIAETAEQAVEKAAALNPDLVLMDIDLKDGEDGVTAARRIQENRRVPVIYTTSHDDEATLQRAKITDPFAYLVKPVREKELAIAIELAISRYRAEVERENLIRELREALNTIKTLQGMLPICSYCKQVRDDQGYWSQVETYVTQHTDAKFTHGVCPDCLKKIESEFKV